MYSEFRLVYLRELAKAGVDGEAMRKAMDAMDYVAQAYDVERKESNLVPIGQIGPMLVEEYLACKSLEGLSRLTVIEYRRALVNFFQTISKPAADIRANDIRAYLYGYKQQRHVSNRSLDTLRIQIGGFFHWLAAEGRISVDPALAIHAIKYTAKPKPSLTQLEMEYIRRKAKGRRERAIVELLYSTGCRVSELCGIKLTDVDFDGWTVQILGKGGKYRTVFLNAKAIVALKEYLATRTDDCEYLIVSERQPYGQLSRYAVEHIIRRISDQAYPVIKKRVTPHIFRHTTVTTALRNGMSLQNVSKMVGHEHIETTMIYAEIDTNDIQRDHARYVI